MSGGTPRARRWTATSPGPGPVSPPTAPFDALASADMPRMRCARGWGGGGALHANHDISDERAGAPRNVLGLGHKLVLRDWVGRFPRRDFAKAAQRRCALGNDRGSGQHLLLAVVRVLQPLASLFIGTTPHATPAVHVAIELVTPLGRTADPTYVLDFAGSHEDLGVVDHAGRSRNRARVRGRNQEGAARSSLRECRQLPARSASSPAGIFFFSDTLALDHLTSRASKHRVAHTRTRSAA